MRSGDLFDRFPSGQDPKKAGLKECANDRLLRFSALGFKVDFLKIILLIKIKLWNPAQVESILILPVLQDRMLSNLSNGTALAQILFSINAV